jgi:hypothetical protein
MKKNQNILLFLLLIITSFGFAQKIPLRYFKNNKEEKNFNSELLITTKKDTIKITANNGEVLFPKIRDNFTLFIKMEKDTIKLGSFRSETILYITEIVVGRISDFSKLKRYEKYDNTFLMAKIYPITISNFEKAEEVIFGIIVKNEAIADDKFRQSNSGVSRIVKFKS